MKIQYSDWQNLNLDTFNSNVSDTVVGAGYIENFLDDESSLNISSYSNSSLKGSWSGFSFSISGNHFTDGSDTITLKSLSFSSGTETLKIKGDLSATEYSSAISGYFSSIYYANSLNNTSFSFSGRLENTSMSGTTTFTGSGYQISVTGNFTVTTEGDLVDGTVTAFSFVDNAGRKMTVSDISMAYSTFDSLTDSGSSITDLYNALSFSSNDTITGSTSNDELDGGAGVDTLIGGKGNDTYLVDLLSSGSLEDTVKESKSSGTDTLSLRGDVDLSSAVTITLAKNIENLDASNTADTLLNLTGNASANTITGNDANNVMNGASGNDTLNGGLGNDTLIGGKGNDILDGEAGNDTLVGGKGVDTFVFNLADIGTAGSPSVDTITDFSMKQKDVLDFRDLLPSADESNLTGLLNYIDVTTNGSNTQLHISSTGGFAGGTYDAANEDAMIILNGVNLLAGTDESTLLQNLISKNQLLID